MLLFHTTVEAGNTIKSLSNEIRFFDVSLARLDEKKNIYNNR